MKARQRKKKQFDVLSPNKQKFTKTDVAKYENTWMQLPHIVSLGAQKNFINFSIQLKERGTVEVDSSYFERLIAKAILFKRADKIISDQNFGGYKANIVTYTIAWLSHYTSQRIDLDRIWREQNITPAVQEAIRRVSMEVKKVLTNPANNRIVTEWCKRKECWEKVKDLDIEIGALLENELTKAGQSARKIDSGISTTNENEKQLIDQIADVPAEHWFQLANWAKETQNLQAWQRSLSFSIGKIASRNAKVNAKQAIQGKKILEEAERLGFKLYR